MGQNKELSSIIVTHQELTLRHFNICIKTEVYIRIKMCKFHQTLLSKNRTKRVGKKLRRRSRIYSMVTVTCVSATEHGT